jgi:hypothetical protein
MFDQKCLLNFGKRKSFSEDARRSRSILNGTVDLHVQAADHHRNIASIGIWQHPVNVAGIWRRNPATFAWIRSTRFRWPIWPESGHLTGFRPSGRIPAGPGQRGRIPAGPGQRGRFQAGPGQNGRLAGRIWPDPASLPGFGPAFCAGFRQYSGETAGIRLS